MDSKPDQSSTPITEPIREESLLDRLIFFFQNTFLGRGDAKYERKKLLRKVKKELKTLIPPVYNTSNHTITSHFAELLFEIYRFTNPLKAILSFEQSKLDKSRVEQFFVEIHLNETQKNIIHQLNQEEFAKILEEEGVKGLDQKINDILHQLQNSITREQIIAINANFTQLIELSRLAEFDMYQLLRRFAPALKENVITDPPKFREVDGRYLIDELKELSERVYSMNLREDFIKPLSIFGDYKGKQILPDSDIKKLVLLLNNMVKSNYLPLITGYILKDPFFRAVRNQKTENLVQNYMKDLLLTTKKLRDQVVNLLRKHRINQLTEELFGTSQIRTIEHYTEALDDLFQKAKVETFSFVQGLNFLKYFLMEKYNRYIRENLNQLLLHGDFIDQQLRNDVSESHHECNGLIKSILALDQSLDGSAERGIKIKVLLKKAHSEATGQRILNDFIQSINEEAHLITFKATKSFTLITSTLKLIAEDYKTGTQKTVTNIRAVGGPDNKELMSQLVKGFNDMTKLLVLIKAVHPPEYLQL
ncbi:MAG TPA: hypothetical protein ENI73_09265, partial [Spirochaetes bacterium]|nr:hypothetical protein [Spirochaetota bacterium]